MDWAPIRLCMCSRRGPGNAPEMLSGLLITQSPQVQVLAPLPKKTWSITVQAFSLVLWACPLAPKESGEG
jgi:hypothetical protein